MCPPTYSTAARESLYDQITRMIASGTMSMRRACEETGTPVATYKLWQAKHAATGGNLADGRRAASGRPAAISLTADETLALQQWFVRKEGSFAAAVEFFARAPECLPATRQWIKARLEAARKAERHPVWPISLRRLAQTPAGFAEHYQGPKAVQHAAPVGRYDHTVKLPDGRTVPLVCGFAWSFDDYSTNSPYILQYADGKERLCRQILCGLDVANRGWIGHLHVGKERDQYTAADVLDVIRLCIEGQGHQPRVIILEQGRWKGNAVRGIEIDGKGGRRWGSIEDAGIILLYQYSSRGKTEVEGNFDPLQTFLAGEAAEIGRFRGQLERETKNSLAINRGSRNARACGFLTLTESADLHDRMMGLLNDRPKQWEALGRVVSPNALLAEQPFTKRPLNPEHRWLFFPVKDLAVVRDNGFVAKSVDGKKWTFHVNGVLPDVHLPNGYRLLIAFDPERPELGCHVANGETGTVNRQGYRLGQCLLAAAPLLQATPRIDLSVLREDEDDNASYKARKGAIKTARAAYRTILPDGKRGLRTDSARNRQGDRVEIRSGAPETAPAANADHAPECGGGRGGSRIDATRPGRAAGVDTAPPRQTRLKSPANRTPDPDDADDLDAMEAAFLAGV